MAKTTETALVNSIVTMPPSPSAGDAACGVAVMLGREGAIIAVKEGDRPLAVRLAANRSAAVDTQERSVAAPAITLNQGRALDTLLAYGAIVNAAGVPSPSNQLPRSDDGAYPSSFPAGRRCRRESRSRLTNCVTSPEGDLTRAVWHGPR